MLQLPNFFHMTTFTIEYESRDKIILLTSWTETVTSEPLFQNNYLYFKKAWGSHFCWHHQNCSNVC